MHRKSLVKASHRTEGVAKAETRIDAARGAVRNAREADRRRARDTEKASVTLSWKKSQNAVSSLDLIPRHVRYAVCVCRKLRREVGTENRGKKQLVGSNSEAGAPGWLRR